MRDEREIHSVELIVVDGWTLRAKGNPSELPQVDIGHLLQIIGFTAKAEPMPNLRKDTPADAISG